MVAGDCKLVLFIIIIILTCPGLFLACATSLGSNIQRTTKTEEDARNMMVEVSGGGVGRRRREEV